MNSDPLKSSDKKAIVYHTDMNEQMQEKIITICLKFWQLSQRSLDTTSYIKRTLDKKYGPAWHCIIGDEYNSCVTHDSQYFIDFKYEKKSFMVYRTVL
ncbi:unnamed protein product [Heterobilharzia americana]|nr:unnamed protein product [Heterobilharzia americana]CAH8443926.1 unnamed protein product [Heterobilharzia americana]